MIRHQKHQAKGFKGDGFYPSLYFCRSNAKLDSLQPVVHTARNAEWEQLLFLQVLNPILRPFKLAPCGLCNL